MSQAHKDVVIDTLYAQVIITQVKSRAGDAEVLSIVAKQFSATCGATLRGDSIIVVRAPQASAGRAPHKQLVLGLAAQAHVVLLLELCRGLVAHEVVDEEECVLGLLKQDLLRRLLSLSAHREQTYVSEQYTL